MAPTVILGAKNVAKPSSPANIEEVPSSCQASHIELYEAATYPFYNNILTSSKGPCYASHDAKLHGFVPVASALDLHDPNTGQPLNPFTDPVGLGLMKINPINQHPDKRFGFPYLSFTNNPHVATPFDAVYAIGTNNGVDVNNVARPDNQLHIEDPQVFIGDYLAGDEVAPEQLFLSNQTIGGSASLFSGYNGGYIAEFEARHKIILGSTDVSGGNMYALYFNSNFLTPNGDLNVDVGTKAIFHIKNDGDFIEFLPGVNVPTGAELDAFVETTTCANTLFRRGQHAQSGKDNDYLPVTITPASDIREPKPSVDNFKIYPNPTSGNFSISGYTGNSTNGLSIFDMTGKVIYKADLSKDAQQEIQVNSLDNGLYLMYINESWYKLIISK